MSIFDVPDGVASVATWRCPRCHTVQARTTRCWRCSQAAYTCRTCRRFEPSVADGLGTCASDPGGAIVSAADSQLCWEPIAAAGPRDALASQGGLFAELEPVPQPTTPERAPRTAVEVSTPPPRPRSEEPGRAAWAQPDEDRLIEAPAVEPGKRLTTEVQRRRRRWFR